jgi:hypothetical protein
MMNEYHFPSSTQHHPQEKRQGVDEHSFSEMILIGDEGGKELDKKSKMFNF